MQARILAVLKQFGKALEERIGLGTRILAVEAHLDISFQVLAEHVPDTFHLLFRAANFPLVCSFQAPQLLQAVLQGTFQLDYTLFCRAEKLRLLGPVRGDLASLDSRLFLHDSRKHDQERAVLSGSYCPNLLHLPLRVICALR